MSTDSLDRYRCIGTNLHIPQMRGIQLVNHREVTAIFPEKSHQASLAEESCNLNLAAISLPCYQDSVNTLTKCLNGLGKVCGFGQECGRVSASQSPNVSKWDRFALSCSSSEPCKQAGICFSGLCDTDSCQEVGVQCSIVEGANDRRSRL